MGNSDRCNGVVSKSIEAKRDNIGGIGHDEKIAKEANGGEKKVSNESKDKTGGQSTHGEKGGK